jgi:hypothetical protein
VLAWLLAHGDLPAVSLPRRQDRHVSTEAGHMD